MLAGESLWKCRKISGKYLQGWTFLVKLQANSTNLIAMRCVIWYQLFNLKNVKAPTEDCYF